MRTIEKQRIFKRFMSGQPVQHIAFVYEMMPFRVEQAIRDVVATKIEFYESWTESAKRKDSGE
jgi:hypothetical protein